MEISPSSVRLLLYPSLGHLREGMLETLVWGIRPGPWLPVYYVLVTSSCHVARIVVHVSQCLFHITPISINGNPPIHCARPLSHVIRHPVTNTRRSPITSTWRFQPRRSTKQTRWAEPRRSWAPRTPLTRCSRKNQRCPVHLLPCTRWCRRC